MASSENTCNGFRLKICVKFMFDLGLFEVVYSESDIKVYFGLTYYKGLVYGFK